MLINIEQICTPKPQRNYPTFPERSFSLTSDLLVPASLKVGTDLDTAVVVSTSVFTCVIQIHARQTVNAPKKMFFSLLSQWNNI